MLKRADKVQLVTELTDLLREAPAVLLASFRALPMGESARLRRRVRESGGSTRVIPKRLFRRVLASLGWPEALAGTADSLVVAWGPDVLVPTKALHDFAKGAAGASLLGGVLEGKSLPAADVERLALLPPLGELRGQFVGLLASPLRGLVAVTAGVLRSFPAVLQAKAVKP